jgi:antitoxin component YwqK of YwqJK toxin-antitoxin module
LHSSSDAGYIFLLYGVQWGFRAFGGTGYPANRWYLRAQSGRSACRRARSIKAKRTDGPFTELWPNGKKRVEGTYKNKELSGPYKEWHENGQICEEGSYIDGKKHGQWKDYRTDSAGRNYKYSEVTWKDGK